MPLRGAGVPLGLFSDSAPTHLRCAGVPLGLFGKPKRSSSSRVRGLHQAILWPLLQNARPPGSLRSPSDAAPECFFKTFRCSARLIFRFRTDPPSVRRCSARLIRQAETLELQPRSRPPSSHTMAFAPKRSTSRFAPLTLRWAGELRSPLHAPSPAPAFHRPLRGLRQTDSQEDVFIPQTRRFAQLSLAHSAAFCYSFLNNRTRCGKRRLLP